jgi:hypothetical protein
MARNSMLLRVLSLVLTLFFCLPLCGFAANTGDTITSDDNRTKVDLYLYFWPAGLDGDLTAGSHTTHTNMKFGDILRDLKMEANGAFKISKEDWFLFNDFIYLDLSHETNENIPSGLKVDATLDATTFTNMFVVGRQWHNPISWNVFAGVRYIYGRVKLDATASLGSLHHEAIVVKTKGWFTPAVGVGINLPLNDKLFFNFIADIGAATKSFNWEIFPTFSWKFNPMFTAEAGYRLLDIRYKEDGFKMDTVVHGPIVGLKISL